MDMNIYYTYNKVIGILRAIRALSIPFFISRRNEDDKTV